MPTMRRLIIPDIGSTVQLRVGVNPGSSNTNLKSKNEHTIISPMVFISHIHLLVCIQLLRKETHTPPNFTNVARGIKFVA